MTSTEKFIWVWDNNDGRLLVDIKVPASSPLWCKNHFVLTRGSTIKQIDAATRSTILEWSIPSAWWPWIALSQHGKFIACSAEKTITFWDIMMHSQLSFIRHTHNISSIGWSPDGRLLLIASGRHIIVKDLSSAISCLVSVHLWSIFYICLPGARTWYWQCYAQCMETRSTRRLMSATILTSKNGHHAFASWALVQACLGQWQAALINAGEMLVALLLDMWTLTPFYTKSIRNRPSIIGYIAQYVAFVGSGETDKGFQVCGIPAFSFRACYPSPSHQSTWFFPTLVLFQLLPFSGCCSLHGWRERQCDIMHGWSQTYIL